MEAPNVIFVDDLAVVNDSVTKISIHSLPNFSEYIRKDALLEWAKESRDSIGRLSYGEFIDKLNAM